MQNTTTRPESTTYAARLAAGVAAIEAGHVVLADQEVSTGMWAATCSGCAFHVRAPFRSEAWAEVERHEREVAGA